VHGDVSCTLQNSLVDIWLTLINGRIKLLMGVTSGNVSLTSDPILPTYDLLNADHNDSTVCSFYVDIEVDRNRITMTGFLLAVLKVLFIYRSIANILYAAAQLWAKWRTLIDKMVC